MRELLNSTAKALLPRAVVERLRRRRCRALKPGGILLATFPSISQVSLYDVEAGWGDYWRFTRHAVERVLAEIFSKENVRIGTHGNVLAAASFLYGLASSELSEGDPEFVMLVTARARKPISELPQ